VTNVLELQSVAAAYGPFRALFGVSFTVGPGEAVALVGANGSGKTTVARVASGLVAPTGGKVFVDGDDLTGKRAYQFAQHGVSHAVEGRSVFATLSVEENLSLSFRRALGRGGVRSGLDEAYGMFPVLGRRKGQLAGTLSGGEQRMLFVEQQVGHALKLCDRVALLDHGSISWTGTSAEAADVVTQTFDVAS
jgi:branched-chain amino acid transport system ATP-binding protein